MKFSLFLLLLSEQRYTRFFFVKKCFSYTIYISKFVFFLFLLLFTIFSILIFPPASAIRRHQVLVLQTPPLLANFLSCLHCLEALS